MGTPARAPRTAGTARTARTARTPRARLASLALTALAALAAPAAAQFTVSGTFTYEDKEWGYTGWTGADPSKPIRRADVTVLNDANGTILGSGYTADDGSFAIACTGAGTADVVVRCDADTNLYRLANNWQRIRVTTESNVEYSVSSPVFAGHPTNQPLNVGTVDAAKLVSGGKEGNPFDMLDMGVSAMIYVLGPSVAASPSGSTIRFYWPGGSGSYASGAGAHMAEDDGYDDAVILHELGHVVQNLWSESDNPGGTHFFGDSDQDPRLSMGEGYATFFNGCVLDSMGREGLYVDANGGSQNGGYQLRLRMETAAPYANDAYGAADEVAVAVTLYDLIDSELTADTSQGVDDDAIVSTTTVNGKNRHRAWWDVFAGPVAAAANLTINDAWDGWFSVHAADPHQADVQEVYEKRRMRFWLDDAEPDGTLGQAVPQTPGLWSGDRTLYASAAAPGTGDVDHVAFDLVVGSVVTFETRYPGGAGDADTQADTHLDLHDPSGALAASADSGGVGRNAAVTGFLVDETGTWTAAVRAQAGYRRYGRYNVRAFYTFENHVPVVTAGPGAAPASIPENTTTMLSVTAFDADFGQTLAYAWTPLDGGSIQGSGASVTFVPPDVAVPTVVGIQLVVSDDLGAQSAPALVEVTVTPVTGPCAQPAALASVGTGKPGTLGVPVLAGDNLPVVPSNDFALHASNCLPGLSAYLIVGFSLIDAPFDQGTLHPATNIVVPLVVNGAGQVVVPVLVPNEAFYCGLTLHAQVLVMNDPGAAGQKKSAQTNGLSFTFGG